jgi:glycosyltransferase involved in cell wall biosynthesis
LTRIAILSFSTIARDPRILRQVSALSSHADIVTCGKGPKPPGVVEHLEIPEDAQIIPRSALGLTAMGLRRTEWAYRNLPSARAAEALLAADGFDLIIANDIHALPVALKVAAHRPVLADLHEYSPRESEEDWRWRLTLQGFNRDLCRRYLPKAGAVTTVCDSLAREYSRQFNVPVRTVTNAGPYRAPRVRPTSLPIRLAHTGTASRNRNLDVMIDGVAGLPGVTLDMYLVTPLGDRPYGGSLGALARKSNNVRVLDPVPPDEVPMTLDMYDVGIFVLPPVNFSYRWALPNKIFDFIQSGLGVVVGPSPEMARIVRQYDCGLVLGDFSRESLRSALSKVTPDQVSQWKANSCVAARALSAEPQSQVLVEIVMGLLEN